MASPFIYGTTVGDYSFTNREKDIDKLYVNLTQGINTTIISPRRWGKSSLVERLILKIDSEKNEFKTVMIDLFGIESQQEFLEVFTREVIKASSSKVEEWTKLARSIFKRVIPTINIKIDQNIGMSLKFNWENIKEYKDEILNMPEEIAKRKGIKFIICIDEFQNLAEFDGYEDLERKMRSCWQRQKNVSYCLYGSKRHMMSDIFNNSSKPFFKFGDTMLLQKIATHHWVPFITSGFSKTGKKITSKNAEQIARIMKNHPWYVQQLSHYTWQKTSKKVNMEIMLTALEELISANLPFFISELESMSRSQINLLKAISNQEQQLTSVAAMNKYKLGTPNNVTKNKRILAEKDKIAEVEKGYEFLDPAFELWFKKQFFKKEINYDHV